MKAHFAFVIILKKNIRNKIVNLLSKKGIETRPIVSEIFLIMKC